MWFWLVPTLQYGFSPVPEEQLKTEVWGTMQGWAEEIRAGKSKLDNRFYQAFAVLMYCRMLHSLVTGQIQGKPAGAAWGLENLDLEWHSLIEDAINTCPHQYDKIWEPADPEKLARTYNFISYALDVGPSFWESVQR